MKKSYFNLLGPKYFLLLVFISSCSGGGSSEIKTPEISDLNINLIGLKTPSRSYEYQDIQITSNIAECSFNISLDNQDFYKIHHVKTNNNKNFVFRNPLIYSETENFQFKITTIENFNCPNVEKI